MSDFVITMKDWKRLCDSMDKKYSNDCCKSCPLCGFGCGGIYEMPENTDWRLLQERVAAWAAENPELVYPTWREWLIKLGIISFEPDMHSLLHQAPTTLTNAVKAYLNEEGSKPIPADIAEKLGLKPKGGNGK